MSRFQNSFSERQGDEEQQTWKAVSQAVSDCMFEKNFGVDGDTVNNNINLPKPAEIDQALWSREAVPSMDFGGCAVFMPYKRPVIESPNINALGISQLELSMSRDPEWAPVLTQLFFFIERVAPQITHQMMNTLNSPNSKMTEEERAAASNNRSVLFDILNESIKVVKSDWLRGGEMDDAEVEHQRQKSFLNKIGTKRTYEDSNSGTPDLSGIRAKVSGCLYKRLHEICIVKDWDPATIIGLSQFLVGFTSNLNDFVTTQTNNPGGIILFE